MPRGLGRRLVGIAGPPGSGKSTLAARVAAALGTRRAVVLPMDGYHLDNADLDRRGLRDIKGAPETFDADGFVTKLRAVRKATGVVRYPVFDRAADRTVPEAGTLHPQVDTVVVEGNYLLLQDPPWNALRSLLDASVMIAPPETVLLERLVERWLTHGLSPEAARRRAAGNDLRNVRTVLSRSAPADLLIGTGPQAGDPDHKEGTP
ncbi:uridine kinase [Rhodobacteraceae bacterium ASV31]|nr:uridine kinase [Anianabacter salinae]